MKTIIVPLDFSNESLLGLDQSMMLAQKTGANILMVHVLELKAGTDITLDYAASVNADLISIMTEQEMSVSNLLLGTYAHQMINKACIPVLSFPNYHLGILEEDFRTSGVV